MQFRGNRASNFKIGQARSARQPALQTKLNPSSVTRAKREADLKLQARLLPELYDTRSNY